MDQDRSAAFEALKQIETEDSWSNLALGKVLKDSRINQPFVRELVYGVLRNQLLLDYNIGLYLKKPGLRSVEKILLRMGFYQLCYMDSVKEYAAVNETVALAKKYAKGRDGFINAVLRSFVRDGAKLVLPDLSPELSPKEQARALSIRYSVSLWIVRLWLRAYGREQTEAMLKASLTPPPLVIRTNRLKNTRAQLLEKLSALGYEAKPLEDTPYAAVCSGAGVLSAELFRTGCFSVQGGASQLAVHLLDPQPEELILDLCAAPGGKTCAMAEAMENRGRICSFDLYPKRAELIRAQTARLGLTCVEARTQDASVLMEEFLEKADRVLCDVPCSGLGVIRQKPELKLSDRPEDLDALPKLQKQILENGARYVKPGGSILYSTCTVNPAENRQVIDEFLNNNPLFSIEKEQQFFPSENGMDGFYICLMRRQTC